MCDITPGQAIIMYPTEGPGRAIAQDVLYTVMERYGAVPFNDLRNVLAHEQPPVRQWNDHPFRDARHHTGRSMPFIVELVAVPEGTELMFTDELRETYYDTIFDSHSRKWIDDIALAPVRLAASPNWRYEPAAVVDPVPDPFTISGNHAAYLNHLGLPGVAPSDLADITIAVLDNGFDDQYWQNGPWPPPVGTGVDLLSGDNATSGHGTLMAALIASAAPGVSIEPIRMAGTESTEWDTLHALARADALGANIVTLAYRQILVDKQCATCGNVRRGARSEVFAKMLAWASDDGKRAILVAAGNDNAPAIAAPARYVGATPITALDQQCTSLASFANWDGTGLLTVLATPGDDVADSPQTGTTYRGTSFATAYAAALYAATMAKHATTDANAIHPRLTGNAARTSSAYVAVLP